MFNSVMTDLETTGTNPEKNAIIQIAAVKFNYETGDVSDDFFNRCLKVHPGREWDLSTRQWWLRQGNVLQSIEARAENPAVVVEDFYRWLLKDWPTTQEGLHFWSKPATFDYNFVTSYLHMFGWDNPCHYRYVRDMNSFMAGLTGRVEHPSPQQEIPFVGDSHDALFDVIHQIKILLAMKQETTQGVVLA